MRNSSRSPSARLTRTDAVELVQKTMTSQGLTPKEDELGGVQPEIDALVEAVNCHARSLVLLAPYISQFGVGQTTASLSQLMTRLHQKYPDERERSLFASVELSLRRLAPELRAKIKPLGVFQGGAHLAILQMVLELDEAERDLLVQQLLALRLAEALPYNFLRFDPALCPYLLRELDAPALAACQSRWVDSMRQLANFLYQQRFKDTQLSATLTTFELPNLMRLLDLVQAQGEAETTVALATNLEQLISYLGKAHLLARVVAVREAEAKKLGGRSHVRFDSTRFQIERLLERGNFQQAYQEAQALRDKALQAGEGAYSVAAYDIAVAHFMLGRVLSMGGASEAALAPIGEAYQRFQRLAAGGVEDAARMASAALTEQGDCLFDLGRLDEAAAAYQAGIKIAGELKDNRGLAVKKGQLGTVRMQQGRYAEALQAYEDALEIFTGLGEPASVAVYTHQKGMVHEEAGQWAAAEKAYREALQIEIQQKNPAGEASSLGQLSQLYLKMGRPEEAVIFSRQAADKYVEINAPANEGRVRNNLAVILSGLKRYAEARQEIHRAIECDKPYGHAAEPWKTYSILSDIEQADGNAPAAAEARAQAIQLYLAYRRAGGENHNPGGRLCLAFWEAV
jgi:tetratricopeptide (TPR) repeat protein